MLESAQVQLRSSSTARPRSGTQPMGSASLPCATRTRVFNAAKGRTSGSVPLMYRRLA